MKDYTLNTQIPGSGAYYEQYTTTLRTECARAYTRMTALIYVMCVKCEMKWERVYRIAHKIKYP